MDLISVVRQRKFSLTTPQKFLMFHSHSPNIGSVRSKKSGEKRRRSADSKFMLFSTGTSKVAPTSVSELDHHLPPLTEGKSEKSGKENMFPSFLTLHFTSKEEWRLENHGGVKMWVNTKTNEVSLTNPNNVKKTPVHRADVTLRVKAGPVPTGTASNLYDSGAVKELFALLDKEDKK